MKNLFVLLLAVLCLYGCENKDAAVVDMQTTPAGNRYAITVANPDGQAVEPGDFVYFHAALKSEGDSTLFNTREGDGPTPVIQAAALDADANQLGPVEDVLRYMKVGETANIRINISEYDNKPPGMENDTVLIYEVAMSEIVDEEEFSARQAKLQEEREMEMEKVKALAPERTEFAGKVRADYAAGKLDGELKTTESGLKYIIHEEGTGKQAAAGLGVVVQYIGMLATDGSVFDQSFERGEGIPFQLGTGRVIPGWDEGIALLKQGAKATFMIPSELGYGAQGSGGGIPPNSELVFYVELEKVQ